MKIRLLALFAIAVSLSFFTSCMTMPTPGGRGPGKPSIGAPSPGYAPTPSRGWPRPF